MTPVLDLILITCNPLCLSQDPGSHSDTQALGQSRTGTIGWSRDKSVGMPRRKDCLY